MRDCEGNLLIGGLTLKELHVELLGDQQEGNTSDWLLSGRLTLAAQEQDLLEVGRRYRLQLPDGRSGAVVIASMNRYGRSVVAEFQPPRTMATVR